jgi:hypothetical protein
MYLTREEEDMLHGKMGPAVQKSMEILVALGEIYNAERMIPVNSVHMPGSSVVVAGDAGTEFVEEMAGTNVTFKARTTLNPAAIDFERWKELRIPDEYAKRQKKLSLAYKSMGAILSHTCTPYLTGNLPRIGEHVSWGESSAICFVNSIQGARTNREGGPSALASAITGRTPLYGLHLDENRKPRLLVKVSARLSSITDYGALGYYAGRVCKGENPYLTGIPTDASIDQLKMLGAALASSGSVALYHAKDVTPEARWAEEVTAKEGPKQTVELGEAELKKAYEDLSKAQSDEIDVVCIGCPHNSIYEIRDVARNLKSRKVNTNVRLWICTSCSVKSESDRMGYTKVIEQAGGIFMCDTCPVLSPVKEIAKRDGLKTIGTNSAKLAHYAPGQCNLDPHYGMLEKCISATISGRWN